MSPPPPSTARDDELEVMSLDQVLQESGRDRKASVSIPPPSSESKPEGLTCYLGHGHDVELHELDKSGNVVQRWKHTPDNDIFPVLDRNAWDDPWLQTLREWRKVIFDAFLPVGFPHSVSDDYLAYQTFDSLQAFFSTIASLLADRALLQGLGVGDANSSATFALLLTIMKDAVSRIATIVFAQQFGLLIEPDAKKYRFLADLFNDTAFFLELYSPYFGPWGKVIALTTGSALQALCGVSAGASKAALSVHFAKHDNLAELNTKEASQETAVGLIGLLVGTLLVRSVEDHTSVVYLMICLVFAHLWMNYLGVRSVCMTTLNRQRATILFEEYLKTEKVLSPEEVARRESILLWRPVVRNHQGQSVARIEMAQSYLDAMGGSHTRMKIAKVDGTKYTHFVWSHAGFPHTPIKAIFWQGAEPVHVVRSWFKAMEMAWLMNPRAGYTSKLDYIFVGKESRAAAWLKQDPMAEKESKDSWDNYQKRFNDPDLWVALVAQGWNLDAQALETGAPIRLVAHTKSKKDQ